ncbi:MAG: AsmA family protein [Desulfobacter sp.]|nr:MAG: AsmA family protein [Desulfobacter sp.]
MKKMIKWGSILVGLVLVLIVAAIVLVPMFVDVQKYKPRIEAIVAEQTGRSFSMGDDIKLSVFPWVGVSLSDLKLGNAPGFGTNEMISVKGFEVRLKVMPLLSRQIQVDTFIMDSPQIMLKKNKAGKGNWEDLGKKGTKEKPKTDQPSESGSDKPLPIESLMVGKFSIVNGGLVYSDLSSGMTKKISDLNLDLVDISLDKPVKIDFSAILDGHPLSVSGMAGPLGKDPGKEDIGLDLLVKALDELELKLKGRLIKPMTAQTLDLDLEVLPFSPRKLFDRLGQPFPVKTSDPKVLDKVSFKARISGNARAVSLSQGMAGLDNSTLTFTAQAKAFDRPDLKFDLSLDKIDVDRYLPPKEETAAQKTPAKKDSGPRAKTDYAPLRKMVLDGKAKIGQLKAANLKMDNILVQVTGKNGVFNLNPFSMDFYQGKAGVKARVDVRTDIPATQVSVNAQSIQAGPMIRDAVQKEIIEGTLAADIMLAMNGDSPEQIKSSLGGKGNLTFLDGAIVGMDIAGSIRNAASGLGLGEKQEQKPRTDFAELKIPFTADKGLVKISDASLVSPLLRLGVKGETFLVKESLDFRVEPKVVATLKGQGDTKERSGLLIPLVVTGTYASPKVRPDLAAVVGGQIPDAQGIKGLIEGKTEQEGKAGETASPEDKAKSLLKGFIK